MCSFFVLLNMFLAIINDTYAQVKANLDKENISFHTTDYIIMVGSKCRHSVQKKARGRLDACGQGRGSKTLISCGRHKWMTPKMPLQNRNTQMSLYSV